MSDKYERMSLFEQLKSGLEDSIAYSRGELTLVTTELPSPPLPVRADQVRAIRKGLQMSQAVFAATVNVSTRTIQSWEQGLRTPSDAALRVLQIIHDQPQVLERIFDRTRIVVAKAQPLIRKRVHEYVSSGRVAASLARNGKRVCRSPSRTRAKPRSKNVRSQMS